MGFIVGTDIGGTFTDLWVCAPDGQTRVFKSPTTTDILSGIVDALHLAAESYGLPYPLFCSQIERFGHGTTVGLNALLTGNAATTVILTTRGFGDTLEIGRLLRQTSGMNELEFTDCYLRNRHPALVPRSRVLEIDERIDARGAIVAPLEEASAREALRKARQQGAGAIAVCTLWSTQNATHEQRLRQLAIEEAPDCFISISSELCPAVGEYARMSTTAANAALGPVAGRYLSHLQTALGEAGVGVPVLMMTSAGGVLPAAVLNDRPVAALFSGPAAGVIASRVIGEQIGSRNILTIDIGGTSFDVGVVVDGRPLARSNLAIAGAEIRVHSIDVSSIGAGGGSIAWVDFGELRVGPQSAGANPGPACYGLGGTRPTATDADLVLGVLDAKNFLGGRMQLNLKAAQHAIEEHVAAPLGMSVIEAAWAIREVLDNRMADLLRRVTIERGYDPRDFTLFANGGAGPSHAWVLAEELGLDGFVVPPAATAQSAFGTANSDLVFTAEHSSYVRLRPGALPAPVQLSKVSAALEAASAEVRDHLVRAHAQGEVRMEQLVSIRYRGQTHHLDIPVIATTFDEEAFRETVRRFESQYEMLFGRGAAFASAGYEILSVRAVGTIVLPTAPLMNQGEPLEMVQSRAVIFREAKAAVDTAIYRTTFPRAGAQASGPAIIEFPGQSVVIPPGSQATADEFGNLHVRRVR